MSGEKECLTGSEELVEGKFPGYEQIGGRCGEKISKNKFI